MKLHHIKAMTGVKLRQRRRKPRLGLKAPQAGRLTRTALRGNLQACGAISPARARIYRNANATIVKADPPDRTRRF